MDCHFLFSHVLCANAVLLVFFPPALLVGFLDAPPGLLLRACMLGLLFCDDCHGGALLLGYSRGCACWVSCSDCYCRWVFDSVGVWMCGCVVVWVCGCVGVWGGRNMKKSEDMRLTR